MKRLKLFTAWLVVLSLVFTVWTPAAFAAPKTKKLKIGYFGNTCEGPLYAAYEKGFFKEEGLDVEMIKGDANTLKDALATGKIDATDGLLMQWLKPIEQGLDIKFTAGLHTGCIQVLVPPKSNLISIQSLKGKTIGVPAIGGGPMVLLARALAAKGINPKTDVTWKAYPYAELGLALQKKEVDAISLADPLAQMLVDQGKAKVLLNSAKHKPFASEYCCLLVINGKLVKKDPATAAAITRAVMKGSRWTHYNPDEAAKLFVEKKYILGDPAVNAKLIKSYNYIPSVKGGEQAVYIGAKQMQAAGILDKSTNVAALAHASFIKLKGVE